VSTVPTPAAIYMAAALANHHAHCTPCRDIAAARTVFAAENGASMARTDRRELGLRRTAVNP